MKTYLSPVCELCLLSVCDVIATSENVRACGAYENDEGGLSYFDLF